jgi:hypothetical protein
MATSQLPTLGRRRLTSDGRAEGSVGPPRGYERRIGSERLADFKKTVEALINNTQAGGQPTGVDMRSKDESLRLAARWTHCYHSARMRSRNRSGGPTRTRRCGP